MLNRLLGSPENKKSKMTSPEPMQTETAGPSANIRDELNELIAHLMDVKLADLPIPLSEIIFQGFKPMDYLAAMLTKSKQMGISLHDHKRNMMFLGLVCAIRGSKIGKIIGHIGSSDLLNRELTKLRSSYGIVDGRPPSRVTATLPRFLAVTVVPVTQLIYEDYKDKRSITLPVMPDEIAKNFPLIFCVSQAGGLIPLGKSYTDLMTKALAYVQHILSVKFGAKPTKAQSYQFVKLASNSNIWNLRTKRIWFFLVWFVLAEAARLQN